MKNYKNIIIVFVCVVVVALIAWGMAALLNKKPVETEMNPTWNAVVTETPVETVEEVPVETTVEPEANS